jgi:aldehyde dehydrogenase (NAD+)
MLEMLGKHYVGGQWLTPLSDVTMPVTNPASAAQIGTLAMGDARDVDRAVQAASQAFESYSQISRDDRIALLEALLQISRDRLEDLAQAISTEMGAPITMSREVQADAAVGHLEGFLEALKSQTPREFAASLPRGTGRSIKSRSRCCPRLPPAVPASSNPRSSPRFRPTSTPR